MNGRSYHAPYDREDRYWRHGDEQRAYANGRRSVSPHRRDSWDKDRNAAGPSHSSARVAGDSRDKRDAHYDRTSDHAYRTERRGERDRDERYYASARDSSHRSHRTHQSSGYDEREHSQQDRSREMARHPDRDGSSRESARYQNESKPDNDSRSERYDSKTRGSRHNSYSSRSENAPSNLYQSRNGLQIDRYVPESSKLSNSDRRTRDYHVNESRRRDTKERNSRDQNSHIDRHARRSESNRDEGRDRRTSPSASSHRHHRDHRGSSHSTKDDSYEDDKMQRLWVRESGNRKSERAASPISQRPKEKLSLVSRVTGNTRADEKPMTNGRGTIHQERSADKLRIAQILLPLQLHMPEHAKSIPRTAKGEPLRSYRTSYDPDLDPEKVKKHKAALRVELSSQTSDDPRLSAPKRKGRKDLRMLNWKWDSYSTRPRPPPPSRSLVISGLSPLANLGLIKNSFRSFGRLEDFELKYDPNTGASTGICAIRYAHDYDDDLKLLPGVSEAKAQKGSEAAKAAKSAMDGQRIGNDTIKVLFDDLQRSIFEKTFADFLRVKKEMETAKASQAKGAHLNDVAPLSASTPARISSPASSMPPPIVPRVKRLMQDERPHLRTYDRNRDVARKPTERSGSDSSDRRSERSREACLDDRSVILEQLKKIGNPFAHIALASRDIATDLLEELFAAFKPLLFKLDDRGCYVGFQGRHDAVRARDKLDGARISGVRIKIDVRNVEDAHASQGAQRQRDKALQSEPEKTSWTDEELRSDARLLLLRELGIAFVRDLRTRVLDSFVTEFLQPTGVGGEALRALPPKKAAVDEIEIDINREKPKTFNRAAREEQKQRLIALEREAAEREAEAQQASEDEREIGVAKPKVKAPKAKKETKASKKAIAAAAAAEAKAVAAALAAEKKARLSRPLSPLPDLQASGLVEDDEDMYFLRLALEMMQKGVSPLDLVEEDDQPIEEQEDVLPTHTSGSARTEGFYRIPAAEKGRHLAERNLGEVDVGAPTHVAHASARDTRADSRRFVQGIEQHKKDTATDTDILKFNQLRSRKKQLKFAKSPIHDWGLYAMETIPPGDMVIEYVGEIVRQQVADEREKNYERQGNFSTYLFRVDDDIVVDATKKGNIARLMNHCCTPNCNAKILTLNGEKRIVLYAKSLILPGQELTYDYKFQATGDEEDAIACLCGSPGCRKFL